MNRSDAANHADEDSVIVASESWLGFGNFD